MAKGQFSLATEGLSHERPRPHSFAAPFDRIACRWLIARFIDKTPEFLYAPSDQVMAVAAQTGATPYDVPCVEYTHVGDDCSFDTFIKKHQVTDKALQDLAVIGRLFAPDCFLSPPPSGRGLG